MIDAPLKILPEIVLPTVCVNSFPKSGTHLATMLVAASFPKQLSLDGRPDGKMFGSFYHNAWSIEWIPDEAVLSFIHDKRRGSWYKAHCGHKEKFEQAFFNHGVCMIFMYRDLRDVVVSMAYHVESENPRLRHDERGKLNYFPSHEDRLLAIIEGVGSDPGIIERWEKYAPWRKVPWVLPLRYEDVLKNKRGAAETVTQYIIKRTAKYANSQPAIIWKQYEGIIKRALYNMSQSHRFSPTLRVGRSGGWFHEFTPAVLEAFIRKGGNHWLRELGYITVEEMPHEV